MPQLRDVFHQIFQSTPLMRGETKALTATTVFQPISIHSPHARGDQNLSIKSFTIIISIHSPHARGDIFKEVVSWLAVISIHSPHARGDPLCPAPFQRPSISIHSPHARGDRCPSSVSALLRHFNPLPSCEGRPDLHVGRRDIVHFNPLPSCEGRQHKPLKIRLDSRQFIQQKHHSSFF